MLRINLLPSYVAQRRRTKLSIIINVVAFAVVVAALLAYQYLYLVPQDANETALAATASQAAQDIANLQNQASQITSQVAPIQANITFVQSVAQYNTNFPNLYETVAKFTSPRILYTGMSVTGATLTINAYTPSIEELGRYLQIMYHEPDFTSVSISTIPTPDQAAEKIYYYKGVKIGQTGGTITAGGATTSFPGVPPGVSVTLPAGVKLPGVGANQNGPQIQQTPQLAQGGLNAQGGVGGTDAVYSTIMADPNFNPKYFKVKIKKTDGFVFTATCALKTTFTAPTVPTGAVSGAAGAGGAPPPSGPNS